MQTKTKFPLFLDFIPENNNLNFYANLISDINLISNQINLDKNKNIFVDIPPTKVKE